MMRLLFVDDEPDVLLAMRRNMREMRHEWSMEFASSGTAALEELAKTTADVIVSDMQMPTMDGWQLLAQVKKQHPATIRFVLSGDAEADSIMRAVGTVHQYLAKPCDSATLKVAISRTYDLRQLLSSEPLARLVGSVDSLPSPPQAFQDILACVQKPTATIAEVASIIARDVAMTANVLKLVNSAFFGLRQPVSTAERAVAYLGLDTIVALVLGHGVFKGGAANSAEGAYLEKLWKHSIEVATTARALALFEKLPRAKAEEAFLGGMLHDVGRVVLASRGVGKKSAPLPAADEPVDLEGCHAEIGAYLLGLWGFPTSVVEAVAYHHSPERIPTNDLGLASLVHLADQLVHIRHEVDTPVSERPMLGALLTRLGLLDHWAEWLVKVDPTSAEATVA